MMLIFYNYVDEFYQSVSMIKNIITVLLNIKNGFWILQEVSSMLLEKLIAARIGDRPVVFVTHRFVYPVPILFTLCSMAL